MTGIVVRSLPDQLTDLVRERILAGEVAAGRAIGQDSLAAELGVSKIPLREALARLEQEGLVRSHANRGYFVRELSAAEAEEVYALRLKLEPELAALAAARADEDERALAATALADLEAAAGGPGAAVANRRFHLTLIRPAGQPITAALLERLHVLGERYVRKHLEPLGRDERAYVEHAALLTTWLARDGKQVERLTRDHIARTIADLRRQLPDDS